MSRSRLPRSWQIILAMGGYAWAWLRLHRSHPERLPEKLRGTLESLGTTFIKLGQGLSVRRDLLPAPYLAALERLQGKVPPFPSVQSRAAIEAAFSQPISALFSDFENEPFAAASVAQVHRARMPDGCLVAVKVRRPGIVRQIQSDLKLLRRMVRLALLLFPKFRMQQPLALVDELTDFLMKEVDLVREAANMRRLAKVFATMPEVTMPTVVEPLVHTEVLVQTFSSGHSVVVDQGTERAHRLATVVLDAYVTQLFSEGVFHADPHPGNLFEMADGRLCFHDFGSIGFLDPQSRASLAQLIDFIVTNDASGVLDAAMELGFIRGPVDRRAYQRAISEILERMASLPLTDWSVAEAIWQIAKVGSGEHFRLPRHLLILLRTLFLAENTIRALEPNFDLVATLRERRKQIGLFIEAHGQQQPLAERVARTAQQLPALVTDVLRQLRIDDGRPSLGIHHNGLEPLQSTIARTGNRLALALVVLGLFLAGSILMLHGGGPQIADHVPVFAAVAYGLAALLSLRLIWAIARSGRM
jgi:ubiquinone biosynthesis protein